MEKSCQNTNKNISYNITNPTENIIDLGVNKEEKEENNFEIINTETLLFNQINISNNLELNEGLVDNFGILKTNCKSNDDDLNGNSFLNCNLNNEEPVASKINIREESEDSKNINYFYDRNDNVENNANENEINSHDEVSVAYNNFFKGINGFKNSNNELSENNENLYKIEKKNNINLIESNKEIITTNANINLNEGENKNNINIIIEINNNEEERFLQKKKNQIGERMHTREDKDNILCHIKAIFFNTFIINILNLILSCFPNQKKCLKFNNMIIKNGKKEFNHCSFNYNLEKLFKLDEYIEKKKHKNCYSKNNLLKTTENFKNRYKNIKF